MKPRLPAALGGGTVTARDMSCPLTGAETTALLTNVVVHVPGVGLVSVPAHALTETEEQP